MNMIRRNKLAALAAAPLALLMPALAGSQPPAATQVPTAPALAPPEPTSSAYVLGRDDVVQIGLLGRSDFGGPARVQADGTVQLPFIGKIQAAEHTTTELSEAIRKALIAGGIYSDPVVTIEVVGYASRYVVVLGAFGAPGLLPLNRPYRLSEVLARVGGVRSDAAEYIVVRPETGDERRYPIRDLATGDLSRDPYVKAGDKIYAPTAEVFYIYGKVNAPGAFALTADLTVRMALAKAGGLAESGSDKKVEVTRGGKKTRLSLDDKVQPGDVMVVGERLF